MIDFPEVKQHKGMTRAKKIGVGVVGGLLGLTLLGAVIDGTDGDTTSATAPVVTKTVQAPAPTVTKAVTHEILPPPCVAALKAGHDLTETSDKLLNTAAKAFTALGDQDFAKATALSDKIVTQRTDYDNKAAYLALKTNQCRAAVD